jgi:hypothetical protein
MLSSERESAESNRDASLLRQHRLSLHARDPVTKDYKGTIQESLEKRTHTQRQWTYSISLRLVARIFLDLTISTTDKILF